MKIAPIILTAVLSFTGCSSTESTDSNETKKIVKAEEYKSVDTKTTETEAKQFISVSAEEAEKMINEGQVLVIDVRSPESFLESHLPNAKNIPIKELEEKNLQLDKNKSYLIVCKAGKTSEQASTLLSENGFKNIYNLIGGMDGWTGNVVKLD